MHTWKKREESVTLGGDNELRLRHYGTGDKRDARGTVLRYKTIDLAGSIAMECLERVKRFEGYQVLSEEFDKEKVRVFFLKFFNEEVAPIALQLSLFDWITRNLENGRVSILEIPATPFAALYFDVISELFIKPGIKVVIGEKFKTPVDLSFQAQIKRSLVRVIMSGFGWLYGKTKIGFLKGHGTEKAHRNLVGICSNEGIDLNKRSDLFWYPGSGLNPGDVVFYFGSSRPRRLQLGRRVEQEKRWDQWSHAHVEYFQATGFHYITPVKLHLLRAYQPHAIRRRYQRILGRLSNQKASFASRPEKHSKPFILLAKYLVSEVQSWHGVFSSTAIKIHWDCNQSGVKTIIKNIALSEAGGVSAGRERSFTYNAKGDFIGDYPHDVFFVWGEESARRLRKTDNGQRAIAISGFPYDSIGPPSQYFVHAESEVERMRRAGVKLVILLLDNAHSSNERLQQQLIFSDSLREFYSTVIEWVLGQPDVGLVIKSKRRDIQMTLPGVPNLIASLHSTGRCYNLEEPFQVKPGSFSPLADITIATGTFFSGALIESVLGGGRGVFYDYPNLEQLEEKFYSWGNDRLIYRSLDRLLHDLEHYKNGHSAYSEYGNWAPYLQELESYRDGRGGERIGCYMKELWKELSIRPPIDVDSVIQKANSAFVDRWGPNSIYDVR